MSMSCLSHLNPDHRCNLDHSAGLLLRIEDTEPRVALDFEDHPGLSHEEGWRSRSSKHQTHRALVRLPLALHSKGWLQTQEAAVDCSQIHMLTSEGIQTLGCWLGHPTHPLHHETGLPKKASLPAAAGLDAGDFGYPSLEQQHANEPAGKHRSLGNHFRHRLWSV